MLQSSKNNIGEPIVLHDVVCDKNTNILHGAPETYEADPYGLGHVFYKSMQTFSNCVAQVEFKSLRNESYSSLLSRSVRLALALRRFGIVKGDVVSICSINDFDNAIPFIATQMVGAILASTDPKIGLSDTQHLLQLVKPKIIFVSRDSENMIEDALMNCDFDSLIIVSDGTKDHQSLEQFCNNVEGELEFKPHIVQSNSETAIVVFSSGTTGLSKGICLTHYGLACQAYHFVSSGYNFDVTLSYASTYWISTTIFLTLCIMFGKTRVITAQYNSREFWRIVADCKVTFAMMAPIQAIGVMKTDRPENIDTTCLSDLLVSGGTFSEDNNQALKDLLPGTHVHVAYGQTEGTGMITGFRPCDSRDVILFNTKVTSCGKPLAGFSYKVVDPESEEIVGINKQGEIRYKSLCQMNGYYNMDASQAFDSDGFVRTGDVGYYDEDFCFYVVDRIKDMLKFRAYHVPPAKIEGIILTHPKVLAVAVIGIPHEIDGDHPMAFIIPKWNTLPSEEDIIKYVEERVDDRYRLRGGVKFVEKLPYTPSGKVKKNILKKIIYSDHEK